jgi:hypothetical protein
MLTRGAERAHGRHGDGVDRWLPLTLSALHNTQNQSLAEPLLARAVVRSRLVVS